MVTYPISTITQDRGRDWATNRIKPYHWLLFIDTGIVGERRTGIAYQLHGMPGGFHYDGPEPFEIQLTNNNLIKQILEVGEVEDSQLDDLSRTLHDVPIVVDERSSWNCQDWTLAALEKFRELGWIHEHLTTKAVRHWLREPES